MLFCAICAISSNINGQNKSCYWYQSFLDTLYLELLFYHNITILTHIALSCHGLIDLLCNTPSSSERFEHYFSFFPFFSHFQVRGQIKNHLEREHNMKICLQMELNWLQNLLTSWEKGCLFCGDSS